MFRSILNYYFSPSCELNSPSFIVCLDTGSEYVDFSFCVLGKSPCTCGVAVLPAQGSMLFQLDTEDRDLSLSSRDFRYVAEIQEILSQLPGNITWPLLSCLLPLNGMKDHFALLSSGNFPRGGSAFQERMLWSLRFVYHFS